MTLRAKILAISLAFAAILALCSHSIAQRLVYPEFESLAKIEAHKDISRCIASLQEEMSRLSEFSHQLAAWDQTYEFASNGNRRYIDTNLPPQLFVDKRIDIVLICDTQGKILWGAALDPETKEPAAAAELAAGALPPDHPFLAPPPANAALEDFAVTGFCQFSQGLLMGASRPIITSQNQGPERGRVIMGRFVTDSAADEIASPGAVQWSAWPLDTASAPDDALHYAEQMRSDGSIRIEKTGKSLLGYAMLTSLDGADALMIRTVTSRDVIDRGGEIARYVWLSTLGVGLCIILALAALLQNLVARPIARMTRHALHVGEQDDLEARLDMRRRDEIGLLANELDRMVGRMAKARKRLALQNYAAGLAEMAAETLHNARNAMAPAVARLDSMRHSLRDLGLDRVGAALDELLAGTADAPRRDGLRRYVSLSTQRAQTAWSDVCAGLDEVNAHLSRMETLLERAETASRIKAPRERINSRELLEEALLAASPEKMASTSPALQPPGDSGASMIFEAPRATLLRALILLIECAAQTLRQACAEDRRILLSVGPSDSPGRPGVMYCIAMPGLERSTQDCHSLFARDDLSNGNASSTAHLCANAAMAMNGRLAAETGREGRGVSFHLWLPRE